MSTLEKYMQSKRSGLHRVGDFNYIKEEPGYQSGWVNLPNDTPDPEHMKKSYDVSKEKTSFDKNLIISVLIVGLLAFIVYLLVTDKVPRQIKEVGATIERGVDSATLDLKAEFLKWAYDPRTGFGLDCVNIKPINNHQYLGYDCRITEGNRYENGKVYLGREVRPESVRQIVN